MMDDKLPLSFTSKMTKRECILALCWLPVHVFLLPNLAVPLLNRGLLTDLQVNVLVYALGAVFMLISAFSFLRREFDPLCDRLAYCLSVVLSSYFLMMGCNLCVSWLLSLLANVLEDAALLVNQNNAAILDLAGEDYGVMAAMAVFLAPLIEEPIFRGAVFGSLRAKNRAAAYAASVLLFALYHVWPYAMAAPVYWLFILQYVPAGFLLARCYEKTNSIWCSIFFHMLVNGVSMKMLSALQEIV